ncbi:MAG: hypothetical protein LUE22_00245 [Oscillospiraceae bacterium]|nr:hypothetical protein [Oscillospiraceae bacterium]
MDSDLSDRISAVLSDPEQMGKIAQMAKGLMGGANESASESGEDSPPAPEANGLAMPGGDTRLLSALGKIFSGGEEKNSKSAALLMAMRPYMRPEKQEKLDRAMKIAQMVHIAGAVMREYGGSGDGL